MKNEGIVVALDKKGHYVVIINHILFYGKKNIPWNEVERYLKRYIGDIVKVSDTEEAIHIGSDFPDEFKGSEDTRRVKGANAKAKANSIQGLHEMIHISKKVSETENKKDKNEKKAPQGWRRYLTRFALPVIMDEKIISHYNIYLATLIVRVDGKGTLHLYDIVNVKKESSAPFEL